MPKEIKATCHDCNRGLKVHTDEDGISVEPCKHCMAEAKQEGKEEAE